MRLVPLPSRGPQDDEKGIRRFMSERRPWLPTSDLREAEGIPPELKALLPSHRAAHGGHVYCQCGMAASRALRESETVQGTDASQYGLHVRKHFSFDVATELGSRIGVDSYVNSPRVGLAREVCDHGVA